MNKQYILLIILFIGCASCQNSNQKKIETNTTGEIATENQGLKISSGKLGDFQIIKTVCLANINSIWITAFQELNAKSPEFFTLCIGDSVVCS